MRSLRLRLALAAVATLMVGSCGGGGDDGPSGNTGTIALAVNPANLSVQQGGTGTVAVSLTRGGGFTGAVSVAVEGLPSGVTVAVDPPSLGGATTSATVAVTVASTVAAGNYTATVRGTATGVGSATTTYTLTVTATSSFTLATNPAALTIGQGGSGTTTVALTRTNFTGAVALALDAPPMGISGSFNPASTTTDNSSLTVTVDAGVATGSHTLTVRGTGTGVDDRTATIALTVVGPPDYALSVTPAALSVATGAAGTATVDIARTNFTGAVTLSLESPPAGVSASFAPASPTGTTSAMTLNVAANTVPGVYTITVKGSAQGIPTRQAPPRDSAARPRVVPGTRVAALVAGDRTTTLTLTVTAAPSISMTLNPSQFTIEQGDDAHATLTLTRVNFTGSVAPTAGTLPAGVTVTSSPPSGTGDIFTIDVTIGAAVPVGAFDIVLMGVGAPNAPTATLHITVVAPSASDQVDYQFCDVTDLPLWFAYQDGNGPWTTLAPTTVGGVTTYRFNASAATVGVAFVTSLGTPARATRARVGMGARRQSSVPSIGQLRPADARRRLASRVDSRLEGAGRARISALGYDTQIIYATRAEMKSQGLGNCVALTPTDPLTVSFTNLAPPNLAWFGTQGGFGSVTPPQTSGLIDVPRGAAGDVFAFFGTTADVMRGTVQRNVTPPASVTFDYGTAPAVATANATLTSKPPQMDVTHSMLFGTSSGISAAFPYGENSSTSSVLPMFSHTAVVPTDFWGWDFTGSELSGTELDIRSGTFFFDQFGPKTWATPPAVPAFTVSQPAAKVFELAGTLDAVYSGEALFISLEDAGNIVDVMTTAGWRQAAGSGTQYALRTVDFTALSGYPAAATLTAPLASASAFVQKGPLTPAPNQSFIISARIRIDP